MLIGGGVLVEPLTLSMAAAQVLTAIADGLRLLGVLLGRGRVVRRRVGGVAGLLAGVADQAACVEQVLVGVGIRVRVLIGLGVLVEPLTLGVTAAEVLAAVRDVLRLLSVLLSGSSVTGRRIGRCTAGDGRSDGTRSLLISPTSTINRPQFFT